MGIAGQPETEVGANEKLLAVADLPRGKKALGESEDKFSKVFHAAPAFLAVTTLADGRFLEVNESFERVFGYRAEEVIGRSSLELDIWENPTDRGRIIETLQGTGKVRDVEINFRDKAGKILVGLYSAELIEIEGERYLLSLVNDITARKWTEEALQRSEMRYKAIVGAFDGFIYICSQDYRVEFMNDQLALRTGYEAIGELCYKVLHDRDSVCPWCLNERVWQGETVRWEVQSPKDSRWYYVVNTPIFNPDGTMSKQAMITDITERKLSEEALRESEERFRRLYNETPVMLHSIDRIGRLVSVSDYWLEVLGYERSEVIGRKSTEFLTEASRRHAEEVVLPEYFGTGFCKDVPYQFIKKNGEIIDVILSATAERDDSGEIVRSLAVMTDVTERKRTEEALRETKEKFSSAFHSTPTILVISTLAEGRYIEVNEAFERLLGHSREETIGRTSMELGIWENPSDRAGYIRMLRDEGKVRDLELNLRSKSGEILVGLLSGEIIEVSGEKRLLTLVSDITARKRAEMALRKSHRQTTSVLESIADAFIAVDSGWQFTYLNGQAELLLQRPRKELQGKKLWDEYPDAVGTVLFDQLQRAMSEKVATEFEVFYPQHGIWAEVRAYPAPDGLSIYAKNITGRKRGEYALQASEERYRRIVETSQEGIVAVDASGRISYVNQQLAEMLGQSGEEIIGRPYLDFIDSSARSEVEVKLERRKGGVREQYETIFIRNDGTNLWGSVSATPILGASGEYFGSIAMISDLSDRKRAAEEIEVLNTNLAARASELEMANEELDAFSSTVSHDLRKPLTAINGYSQLILDLYGENLDEQGRDFLQEIVNGAVRMNQLIDTLLNFSRRTRGDLRREAVDLSEMAKIVIAELRLTNPLRRASCSIAEGVIVDGDASLLRVALDNLLGNAWKYTAKNEETAIEFGVAEHRGRAACFVRDNGVGFDMESAARLFSPFQRLHSAEEFEGIGIGLATVQRIIQRHGGQVWTEGEVGKGATFYFTLG